MGPCGVMSTRATPARTPAADSGTAARAARRMIFMARRPLPPHDCRMDFAHCRDGIIGVALRVLGIHHHPGKAVQNIDGARAALAAVTDGLAAVGAEARPSRRHRHLLLDLRHNGQNHRSTRSRYRHALGFHRIGIALAILLSAESQENSSAEFALRIRQLPRMHTGQIAQAAVHATRVAPHIADDRSAERRVGKECRSRWWPYHYKTK